MLKALLALLAVACAMVSAGDACVNETDIIDSPTFYQAFYGCSTSSDGEPGHTAACLEAPPTNLSAGCSMCFGSLAGCTRDNCLQSPANCASNPLGQGCGDCITKSCMDSFQTCAGLVYTPTTGAPTTSAPSMSAKSTMVYGNVNLNQDAVNYNAVVVGSTVGVLCGVATLLVLFSGISTLKTMM